jgi:AraC family transcriptional activator of pobA
MRSPISTYELAALITGPGHVPGLFFSHQAPRPPVRIDLPYRSGYYKIGICLRGHAHLKVNLDLFEVAPNSLVLTTPHSIKQWLDISPDYHAVDVFFTRAFIVTAGFDPDHLSCFAPSAHPVLPLPTAAAQVLVTVLYALQARYNDPPGPYQGEIVQRLLQAFLYEVAAACEASPLLSFPVPARASLLVRRFKELVMQHYLTERSLPFYATQLCITPKHLTETVKQLTGRTAGEWLAETMALEAKVLLHDPARSIGQVADQLHFLDQSAFGRFFRKCTGLSPSAYRRSL